MENVVGIIPCPLFGRYCFGHGKSTIDIFDGLILMFYF